jgi:mannose-1-phosphate guanylyltransferase
VRRVLGGGDELGVHLRYLEEPRPLGTGGALKFAEDLLDERFLMLNGDVLTDLDLSAQLALHERTGARATLALIAVEDPSAYGLVHLAEDGSITEFVEKPGPEQRETALVNAGAYVLERDVLAEMAPAGTNISIERDMFPTLVARGLFGYAAGGYWLDIGTPERYLQATYDILEGHVRTDVGRRLAEARLVAVDDGTIDGRVVAPVLVGPGCTLRAESVVGDRSVLGHRVTIGEGAHVESSVLLDGVSVGARATVRASIVGPEAEIGDHCRLEGGVVLGQGVRLGAGNALAAGARIFPGVQLPEGAITF